MKKYNRRNKRCPVCNAKCFLSGAKNIRDRGYVTYEYTCRCGTVFRHRYMNPYMAVSHRHAALWRLINKGYSHSTSIQSNS